MVTTIKVLKYKNPFGFGTCYHLNVTFSHTKYHTLEIVYCFFFLINGQMEMLELFLQNLEINYHHLRDHGFRN